MTMQLINPIFFYTELIRVEEKGVDKRYKPNVLEFFMAAAYLPSVLVPLVGLVFPAIAMASLFLYIEKEEIA